MALIDDQGRLFGRMNIVDAAVVLAVGCLLPLMYGAYLLFRPYTPILVAIEPPQVTQGTTRVSVRGAHLRPALRLMVGANGARFLLANPENGVLEIPVLPPGSYDVVLLDESQELGRLRGGLTVLGPPITTTEIVATGSFEASDDLQAQVLRDALQAAGLDEARSWDVLEVLPPEPVSIRLPPGGMPLRSGRYQVRAFMRFRCVLDQQECRVLDVPLTPNGVVTVPLETSDETLALFRIAALDPVYSRFVDVALRATNCSNLARGYLTPQELSALRAEAGSDSRSPIEASLEPTVESFDILGETASQELLVTIHVRVPIVETEAGLEYRGGAIRTGSDFSFLGRFQQLCGRIIDVDLPRPLEPR
jgi:hypothetical protein